MDNSKSNIITEIAQELDCGNDCYYNSKTNEIVSIPDFSQISDEEEFKEIFQAELENILQKKKPFQNFKIKIDHSDFRQSWFDFKQSELEKIVKNQLNR
jgi:inorganic pyrophosphatase/exopolyphosphatase